MMDSASGALELPSLSHVTLPRHAEVLSISLYLYLYEWPVCGFK